MKKLLSFAMSILILIALDSPVFATEQVNIVYTQEAVLENGITIVKEIIDVSNARSTDKSYIHRMTLKDGDTTIGIIAIAATFRYDGTTVSVVSKAVTQSDTYDGWEYVQNSFTSSGGTVTLDAKLTKWIILNTSFTMTLSCDKNGNISYT